MTDARLNFARGYLFKENWMKSAVDHFHVLFSLDYICVIAKANNKSDSGAITEIA